MTPDDFPYVVIAKSFWRNPTFLAVTFVVLLVWWHPELKDMSRAEWLLAANLVVLSRVLGRIVEAKVTNKTNANN